MAKLYIYVLGVIAITFGQATAVTEEERNSIRAAIRPIFEACGEEYGVTRDQMLAAKEAGTLDKFDPCFYACFFKKTGFIDDNGLFDANVALEKNKKHIKGEEDIAKIAEIGKTCSVVNDEKVSDGKKGCERAKLLLGCLIKEKANYTPLASN